jgi:hypothetical protein
VSDRHSTGCLKVSSDVCGTEAGACNADSPCVCMLNISVSPLSAWPMSAHLCSGLHTCSVICIDLE